MEFKGTKGKWEIWGSSEIESEFYANQQPVFDVVYLTDNIEENEANARLI